MSLENPKIIFFGAGAIGASVAGWVGPHYPNLAIYARGEAVGAIRANGVTTYRSDRPERRANADIQVLDDLCEAADADILVLGVKNYSLEPVAKLIKEKIGDRAVIVSMANGIVNQEVLPNYFSKVVYCVVSYNAWLDAPGVVGYQKKGPLIIGTPNNGLREEMEAISTIFNRGVETIVTPQIQDAIHCKIVINLTNSVTTLIGHKFREIEDPNAFQDILTHLLFEGKEIIRAAGHHECRLGGIPSWSKLTLAAKFPRFVTKPIFNANVKKMVMSSMAQDVLQRGGKETELESINGYIVSLADQAGMKAPVNRTVNALAQRALGQPEFKPMSEVAVWAEIKKAMG